MQAPPVTVTRSPAHPEPDHLPGQYGCAFAQVRPGHLHGDHQHATSGIPSGNHLRHPAVRGQRPGGSQPPPTSSPQTPVLHGIGDRDGRCRPVSTTHLPRLRPGQPGQPLLSFLELHRGRRGLPGCRRRSPASPPVRTARAPASPGTAVLTTFNQADSTNGRRPPSRPGATRIPSVACARPGSPPEVHRGRLRSSGAVILSSPTTSASLTTGTALTGVTSLSQMACPSATNCVAIGTTTSGQPPSCRTPSPPASTPGRPTPSPVPAPSPASPTSICPAGATGCVAIGHQHLPEQRNPGRRLRRSARLAGGLPQHRRRSPSPRSPRLACPSTATRRSASSPGRRTSRDRRWWPARPPPVWAAAAPAWTWNADTFPDGDQLAERPHLPVVAEVPAHRIGTKGPASAPLVMYGADHASAMHVRQRHPSGWRLTSRSPGWPAPRRPCASCIGATATAPAIVSGNDRRADHRGHVDEPDALRRRLRRHPHPARPAELLVGDLLRHHRGGHQRQQPARGLPPGQQRADDHLELGRPPNGQPGPATSSDIDCTTSGSPAYCSAVGASATGAVELVSSNGPNGPWTDQTANGLSGNAATGHAGRDQQHQALPSTYQPWSPPEAAPTSHQLPASVPFSGGYGLYRRRLPAQSRTPELQRQPGDHGPRGQPSSTTVPLGPPHGPGPPCRAAPPSGCPTRAPPVPGHRHLGVRLRHGHLHAAERPGLTASAAPRSPTAPTP